MAAQDTALGYGLIGAGAFGQFCLDAVGRMSRLRPIAVSDSVPGVAASVADAFSLTGYTQPEQLLADPAVEVVHIATPPSSHYSLAMAAINAGKHVLCEKPLAMTTDQADRMVRAAEGAGVMLAVNHVLRYSPLVETIKRVIDSGVLGVPLRAFFENYAWHHDMGPDHWFWNPEISGGIFVEHGVHFFDLHSWWFGAGQVVWATAERSPESGLANRVCCAVRYQDGVLGQFYHGFDQLQQMDRADHRVLLQRGDIELIGWIPMELRVHGVVDQAGRDRLDHILQDAEVTVLESRPPGSSTVRARWTLQIPPDKRQDEYRQLLDALVEDQLASIDDPSHQPRLTAMDARNAVALAEQARTLAAGMRP